MFDFIFNWFLNYAALKLMVAILNFVLVAILNLNENLSIESHNFASRYLVAYLFIFWQPSGIFVKTKVFRDILLLPAFSFTTQIQKMIIIMFAVAFNCLINQMLVAILNYFLSAILNF